MISESLVRTAGWSAIANSVLFIISTITLMLMFAVSMAWGKVNDATSVIWILTFIPIAVYLFRLVRPVNSTLSLVALIVGILCMIAFALLQAALVVNLVRFEQTFGPIMYLWVGISFWMIVSALLARSAGLLPNYLVGVTLILGLTFIVAAAGFLLNGWEHPLALAGFAGSAILGPVWGLLLGRYLLTSTIPQTAGV
jgi:hypothetical protein